MRKLMVAVAVAVGVAIGTSGCFIPFGDRENRPNGGVPNTTNEIDPSTAPFELFESLGRTTQLDFAGPILTNEGQAYAEEMRKWLIPEGRPDVFSDGKGGTRQLVTPATTNTAQEVWDQLTIASYQAWKVAHEGDVDLAKKLASGFAAIGSREYNDLVKTFNSAGAPVINAGAAVQAEPVIAEGSYLDVSSNGLGLIQFNKISSFDDNDEVKVVARFERGTAEDSGRWILKRTMKIP